MFWGVVAWLNLLRPERELTKAQTVISRVRAARTPLAGGSDQPTLFSCGGYSSCEDSSNHDGTIVSHRSRELRSDEDPASAVGSRTHSSARRNPTPRSHTCRLFEADKSSESPEAMLKSPLPIETYHFNVLVSRPRRVDAGRSIQREVIRVSSFAGCGLIRRRECLNIHAITSVEVSINPGRTVASHWTWMRRTASLTPQRLESNNSLPFISESEDRPLAQQRRLKKVCFSAHDNLWKKLAPPQL